MTILPLVSCLGIQTGRELRRIESELRSGSADSAALMLSRMERNRMPKAQAARFIVLNAMAADKLNIDDGSLLPSLDSLSEWYLTHGRRRDRMLFWYYYGDQCLDDKRYDDAVVPLARALDLAGSQRDWYMCGMASRLMSAVFAHYYLSSEEYRYANMSESYFRKAGMPVHESYSHMVKSCALYNLGRIEDAVRSIDSLIMDLRASQDTSLLQNALKESAQFFLYGNSMSPEEAYSRLSEGYSFHPSLSATSWADFAYAAYLTGRSTESADYLENAYHSCESSHDSLYVMGRDNDIRAAAGEETANVEKMYGILMDLESSAIDNSPLKLLSMYNAESTRIRQSRMRLTIALCITLIVILILTFVLVSMNRKSRWNRSMLEYQCLLADLKTKLSESDKYSASSDESFMSFLERMQSVFDELYRGVEGNTVQSLKDMLDGIKADSFLCGRLREVFSRQHPDHLSKMVSSGRFTEDEIDLYVMTCLGMSYFTIALLLGVSFNAVCIRVSRLRSKISTAVSGADAEFLISLIPWRRNY